MFLVRFRRWGVVAFVAVLALVATACDSVPNPSPNQVIPGDWGAGTLPVHSDILYVSGGLSGCVGYLTDNEPCMGAQTLDIYPAVLGGNRGTIVYVHGGAFKHGSKYPVGGMGALNRLTHLGWNLVSVDYRLARDGRFPFPAASQDVAAALRWVRANGSAYGLNTDKLVVAGHSAGGTLAALAGTAGNSGRPEYAGVPPLSGWISLAGIMDHTAGNQSGSLLSSWTGNVDARVASPVTWWDGSDPKGLVVHGDVDTLVEPENARRMSAKAKGSDRIQVDMVDVFDNGAPMPTEWRWHGPAPGMNSAHLESWLAGLPTLHQFANPFGSLDKARPSASNPGLSAAKVRVGGWAVDPDTVAPVKVHVYAGPRFIGAVTANKARNDVAAAYPVYGALHGFDVELSAPPGPQRICVYGINVGSGNTNSLLGCKNVTL